MAKKTIRVATWEYRDKAKKRRRAFYGDVVDLPAPEVKRGEAAGVFGAFDEVADESAPKPQQSKGDDKSAGDALPSPPVAEGADDLDGIGDDADTSEAGQGSDADGGDDAGSDAGRPKYTAPHATWVEYAVSQGMDHDEAQATDRADLIKALS